MIPIIPMIPMRFSMFSMLCMLLLLSNSVAQAHPQLIQCVCNTTIASSAVVKNTQSASPSKGQAIKLELPDCLDDVFARSGIRWYKNGPVDGSIRYWKRHEAPTAYSEGRAAQRLISLGYRCESWQLYDPNEVVV